MSLNSAVYIGLGSNLENPSQQIRRALEALRLLPKTELKSLSRIYQSAPVGPAGQPDYLNAVALIKTSLPPETLLDELQNIEQCQQRRRGVHWGPRTIDLDILLYGDLNIHSDRLSIPHPHMLDRNFVLIPILDINPALILPEGASLVDAIEQVGRDGLDIFAEPESYLSQA